MVAGRPLHRLRRARRRRHSDGAVARGAARKVAEFGGHPSWSPDGRRLAFQSRAPADLHPGGSFGSDSTIWIVDTDGRTPPQAVTTPGRPHGSHGMPQWWPDRDRIVFAVAAPSGVFMGAALWTVEPGGGDARRLSAHARLSSEFVVSPDGRGVLFTARDGNALWWLPLDEEGAGGGPVADRAPVTGPSVASLAISADGRRVAWTAGASSSGIGRRGSAAAPRRRRRRSSRRPRFGCGPATRRSRRTAGSRSWGTAATPATRSSCPVGPGPRQLTTDGRDHFSPQWLKGEDALAMLANHGDGMGWWRLDPPTGRERLRSP